MLTIYRRHMKSCPHRSEGRKYRRCRCPIWVDGLIGNQEIRESLHVNNWAEAEEQKLPQVKARYSRNSEQIPPEPIAVKDATQAYLRDAEARGLREPTLYKYRLTAISSDGRFCTRSGHAVPARTGCVYAAKVSRRMAQS